MLLNKGIWNARCFLSKSQNRDNYTSSTALEDRGIQIVFLCYTGNTRPRATLHDNRDQKPASPREAGLRISPPGVGVAVGVAVGVPVGGAAESVLGLGEGLLVEPT